MKVPILNHPALSVETPRRHLTTRHKAILRSAAGREVRVPLDRASFTAFFGSRIEAG